MCGSRKEGGNEVNKDELERSHGAPDEGSSGRSVHKAPLRLLMLDLNLAYQFQSHTRRMYQRRRERSELLPHQGAKSTETSPDDSTSQKHNLRDHNGRMPHRNIPLDGHCSLAQEPALLQFDSVHEGVFGEDFARVCEIALDVPVSCLMG